MRLDRARFAAALLLVAAAIALSACQELGITAVSSASASNQKECGDAGCHPDRVTAHAGGVHTGQPCTLCHAGTGAAHAKDPKTAIATTDWRIDSCAPCHEGEALTYLYDNNAQVGPFGGSQRIPPQPKTDTFPLYNTIIAGHGFTKDYNEEGAHATMLEDHAATKRQQYETCLQCKSSKLAYSWKNGKPMRVASDTVVTLNFIAKPDSPAQQLTVPKGTVITYATDPVSRQVDAKVTTPDGKTYTSRPGPSDDATASFKMLWAASLAAISETLPYGAGCNHCHDPHTGKMRYLRQAMLQSIEGSGGVKGAGGVNPYAATPVKDIERAAARDRRILSCAQCHVEYVCGRSGVDKMDRDAYGWAKASDLHELYTKQFGYKQDWTNAIAGQPMIKNQHPETELYWESVHYKAGAACSDCHMPKVSRNGATFRSHWLTSPYQYRDPTRWAAFAKATGLDAGSAANPCTQCHADRAGRAIEQQKSFFAAQGEVEVLLAKSVQGLGALKSAGTTTGPAYEAALEAHRKAHAIWENLAVSENSMGFHNFEEAMGSMAEAKEQVTTAIAKEAEAGVR